MLVCIVTIAHAQAPVLQCGRNTPVEHTIEDMSPYRPGERYDQPTRRTPGTEYAEGHVGLSPVRPNATGRTAQLRWTALRAFLVPTLDALERLGFVIYIAHILQLLASLYVPPY